MNCPSCAQACPEGARFCPSCGHLLVKTEERRIVTVMFADLVGFTALSEERDPEQVKHLVDSCFQRLVADITAFGGTVDKIVGDGIVALFGAPRAHEDDPERAVRAALRMQRSATEAASEWGIPIRMRVGVNTGEVLVGAIRAGGDYTAMGDTVNLASRLEGVAAPGEVLVSAETMDATRDAIEYEDRGEVLLRGREEAVSVYVARSELAPPGRRRRTVRAPLVGRNLEHLQLTSAMDTSIERNRAQLVLILGEAGMGKTRLAEEVAAAVEVSHDAHVIEARVAPYGESNPYRSLADAIARGLRIEPMDSVDVATAKLNTAVASVLELDPESAEVDLVVQPLLSIFGYESALQSYDKPREREEIHAGVRQYLGGLATQNPLVLVLGDVNWADEALLGLLESCLTGLASLPFVIIATARWTVDEERWIVPPGRHNTTVVNLDALDRVSSDRLVRSLMGADVSDEMASVLFDRSGGNPFFLEELTILLDEAEVVGDADIGAAFNDVEELPDTLRGLVSARLDALSSEERSMVEEAAVIGRSGPVYALLLMADRDGREKPEHVFRQLVGKDVFATESDHWVFRSDLVRDIAYNTLTKTVRAQLHCGIADWTASRKPAATRGDASTGSIAWHYYAAARIVHELGPVDDVRDDVVEQALEWLDRAGTQATRRDSHYAAAQSFARVLELLDTSDPRRVGAAIGRARARMGLLELPGARSDVHDALDLAREIGDDHGAATAMTIAGEIENLETDYDEARRILRSAIDRWRELGDEAHLAESLRLHGFASMMAGDQRVAEDDFSAALAIFVDIEDSSGEAWCQQNLAWLSFELGHIPDAERRLKRAIELFENNHDNGGLGWALGLLAFVRFHEGDSDEAAEIASRVQSEAAVRGDRFGEAMMRLLLASVNLWTGRCHLAIEEASESLEVFRSTDTIFGAIQAYGTLARANTAVGNFDLAAENIEESRRLAEGAPGKPQLAFVEMVAGASAMQRGDAKTAISLLEPLVGEFDDPQIIGSMDRNVTLLLSYLQCGDLPKAKVVLEQLELVEASGPTTYLDSAKALTLITLGDVEAGLAAARSVVDSQRATYLDRRSALIAIGLAHARVGDESATISAFDDAIQMIDETDSRVSQAVTRLARAVALESLGVPEAVIAHRDVESLLDQLSFVGEGWRQLFTAAVTGDHVSAGSAV